jgi:hypothetical protein
MRKDFVWEELKGEMWEGKMYQVSVFLFLEKCILEMKLFPTRENNGFVSNKR